MRRRLFTICAALVSALGLSFIQPPSAEAAFNDNYYRIRANHSNKCLDVANVSPDNGARIQQWDCAAGPQANQLWRLTPQGNGTYMVISLHSGRCLDVAPVSASTGQPIPNTDNSAAVQQWDCNPFVFQTNQTFQFEAVSGGYRLRATHSQRCMDVSGVSVNNGAAIQQWDCAPWYQPNQVFTLQAVAPPNQPAYFGYVHSDAQGIGNYTAQISDHSNLTFVAGDLGTFAPKLALAASLDMYAMVDLRGYFFSGSAGAIQPKSDAVILTEWNAIANEIWPYIDRVYGFNLLDEPYSHNVNNQGISQPAMKAKLAQIAAMIHATFPTKKVGVIFQAVMSHFDIPAGFDWVAFDCYEAWDNCYGYSIRTWYEALKAQLSPGQRIFLVPKSIVDPGLTEQEVVSKANHYADLAYSDPTIIGIVPFHYVSINNTFPIMRAGFVDIGKAITGR
jgi:hypothetical protein